MLNMTDQQERKTTGLDAMKPPYQAWTSYFKKEIILSKPLIGTYG